LADDQPENDRIKIELGCAYVDKIPTCGGLAAIVSKGTLARTALDLLDEVISADSDSWVAYYCRGMNHLHWPRALRHSDDAVLDFELCVELQKNAGAPNARPYYLRSYVALGDAHAKTKKYSAARDAWRQGQDPFPEAEELKERLAINEDDALLEFVEGQRSLQSAIDTDLSFLDAKPALSDAR